MKQKRIGLLAWVVLVPLIATACGGNETSNATATSAPAATSAAAAPTDTTAAAAPTATTASAEATPTTATSASGTGESTPTGAASEATATTATTASGAESTPEPTVNVPAATIRVGTWESGDALKLWDTLISNFQKQYSQIKISFEPVPDNYGTKLLTQIAANDAPDVFQVGDGDVRMFVERGGAADLADYIKGKDNLPGLDSSIYYPNLYQTGVVNNDPYFLTKDYSPLAVYYNKDIFDKAGVAYPKDGWTWDDFRNTAKKLTTGSGANAQYGVELPGNWVRAIEPFIFSNGGSLLSPDATKVVGYLNSPETIEAVQFYVDLYTKDKVSPSPADMNTTYKGVDLFQTGKEAMVITGVWPESGYAANPNFHFGVVGLPMKKQRANAICWAGLGLYKGSKNPDQAWLFLRYIGSDAGQSAFAQNGLPSMPSVADKLGINKDPAKSVFVNEVQYLKPLPDMQTRWWNDTVAKYFGEAIDNLLANGGDVKAALDDAAQKAQTDLDKLRAENK